MLNIKILQQPNIQKWIMIIIFILLFLTLIIGKNINGSKSWINLGFMNLQASELLKIAFILYISYVISRKLPQVREKIKVIRATIFNRRMLILVLLQGDIGQTLLIMIIIVSMFILQVSVSKISKRTGFAYCRKFHRDCIALYCKWNDATLFKSAF